MKLIVAIVHQRDKDKLRESIIQAGFTYTKLDSWGGFMCERNYTYLIGVDDDKAPVVLKTIEDSCKVSERFVNVSGNTANLPGQPLTVSMLPVKAEAGGAVVFVLDVDSFHRF